MFCVDTIKERQHNYLQVENDANHSLMNADLLPCISFMLYEARFW